VCVCVCVCVCVREKIFHIRIIMIYMILI